MHADRGSVATGPARCTRCTVGQYQACYSITVYLTLIDGPYALDHATRVHYGRVNARGKAPKQTRLRRPGEFHVFPYTRKSGKVKGHCRNLHAPHPRARKAKPGSLSFADFAGTSCSSVSSFFSSSGGGSRLQTNI